MADIYDWSVIAADNDDADAAINWMEGQFPDTVNNSARQMMARIAEWIKDQGVLTAAGTAGAITVATANTDVTVPVTGMTLAFRAAITNTGATTLAINGGGSKPLRKVFAGDTDARALEASDIMAKGVYLAHYDAGANTGAGAWILVNPTNYEQMKAVVLTAINNAPQKASVVDADAAVVTDSEDSGKSKRVLWSSIKAWLKTYFDTIYYVRSTVDGLLAQKQNASNAVTTNTEQTITGKKQVEFGDDIGANTNGGIEIRAPSGNVTDTWMSFHIPAISRRVNLGLRSRGSTLDEFGIGGGSLGATFYILWNSSHFGRSTNANEILNGGTQYNVYRDDALLAAINSRASAYAGSADINARYNAIINDQWYPIGHCLIATKTDANWAAGAISNGVFLAQAVWGSGGTVSPGPEIGGGLWRCSISGSKSSTFCTWQKVGH